MQQLRVQRGFALVEALMALMILTFGMLGLIWMHQQALMQQRQQLMLNIAIGIAEDLSERMTLNASQRHQYAKPWGSVKMPASDCTILGCTRPDLAAWDMQQLQKSLDSQLPEGDAAVFAVPDHPDWWGIVIAWRDANETYRTNDSSGSAPCPAQMSCWRLLFTPMS